MELSIIIPIYNEQATILQLLDKVVRAELPQKMGKEIIIIDDFSIDGTRDLLKQLGDKYKIIYHDKNCGKGRAIKTGLQVVTGDIIIIQDADLEYNPNEYAKLLQPILDGKADVVYGSRFIGGKQRRVLFYWHSIGNKIVTNFSNMLTNLNLTDMETGYKLFRKEVIESFKDRVSAKRFGIEPELTALISKGKWRIYEVGISYNGRTYEEGKKISWKDGLAAIWHIIKFNLRR